MYLCYTKKNTKVLVQNSDMNYEIFENTLNIESILIQKNNIETIKNKKLELNLLEDDDEKNIKKMYFDLKEQIENNKLDNLLNNTEVVYTIDKKFKYVDNNNFIEDLYKDLDLINFYLKIRDCLINHKDLNIKFNKKENQRKKLKFLNLCFSNINTPEYFINSLVQKENIELNNKQKKLKYNG